MTFLHIFALYLGFAGTRKPSLPLTRLDYLGSFNMLAGLWRQTLECANMLDLPCGSESQRYLLWQCLQADIFCGSSCSRLMSSQMGELLLLPLALGLLHLVVGGGVEN